MSIKLIAFDLDGTFLDEQKNCIPENMEAICAAADQGVIIVPSSGRMFDGVPEPIRSLPFIRYGITINGAEVCDSWENRAIYQACIPLEDAERIYDYAESLQVVYDSYVGNQGWMDRRFYDNLAETVSDPVVRQLVWQLRTPVDDFRQYVRDMGKPIQKIQLLFKEPEKRFLEIERFSQRFPGYMATTSLYNNMEINLDTANKGAGLKALCEHLGVDISEVMALGDGGNDVSMVRVFITDLIKKH